MIVPYSRKNIAYFRKYGWKKIPFYKISIVDKNALEESFKNHKIYAVVHFARKKAVGESVENPLLYYENMIFFVMVFYRNSIIL